MNELVVKIFLDLVKISSPSYYEKKVRGYIIKYLENLNITSQIDEHGNILARVPGRGRPLILSAHMDTVQPCDNVRPIIKNGVIYSDGSTILGADDKAGIASILSLLTKLKKDKISHQALEIIFTVEEEINCGGAQKLNYKLVKGEEAIVLDRSAPVNAVTLSTPYADKVHVIVKGKSAHSRSPEDGVHAITVFADFALAVKYGRKNKRTVTNIGMVKSGSATNVIPDYLQAEGEIRSLDKVGFSREKKHWLNTTKKIGKKYNASISLDFETMLAGFTITKKNIFITKLSKAIIAAGFQPDYVSALGGSDANVFNQHGIIAVPLGQGRTGAHSLSESMPIAAFKDTENIILNLVKV